MSMPSQFLALMGLTSASPAKASPRSSTAPRTRRVEKSTSSAGSAAMTNGGRR